MRKRLVILTGAGMSAESGISTFRDSNGLWNNYRIEDVATPEGFAKNPEWVLEFYNKRRRELLRAEPNAAHYGLAALEDLFDVEIVTQNVDNLHERAGSSRVLHLHGELMKACSVKDTNRVYDLPPTAPDLHITDKDAFGDQLRPFIVWFGEPVPLMDAAIGQVEAADIFVIIGTSLNVYPAAGLLHYLKEGVPVYLIDPNPVQVAAPRVNVIRQTATRGVRELTEKLLINEVP